MLTYDARTMATGSASIDAQHRQLIEIVNRLMAAMARGTAKDEIGPVLLDLERYAATHFDHEEGCMWRYACPVAKRNVEAHAEFERTFERMSADFDRDGPSPTMALRMQRELSDWIRDHIVGIDVQLRRCIPAGEEA